MLNTTHASPIRAILLVSACLLFTSCNQPNSSSADQVTGGSTQIPQGPPNVDQRPPNAEIERLVGRLAQLSSQRANFKLNDAACTKVGEKTYSCQVIGIMIATDVSRNRTDEAYQQTFVFVFLDGKWRFSGLGAEFDAAING